MIELDEGAIGPALQSAGHLCYHSLFGEHEDSEGRKSQRETKKAAKNLELQVSRMRKECEE